ncbi:MAG TPA: hypothetical protein VF008_01345 [Niastella sp.]
MSGCNDENTAKHAPLQRNNEAGLFCNVAEWVSNASWLYGDGLLCGLQRKNTANHAPLQRNNEAGLFCNNPEWVSHASWLHGDGLLSGCVCALRRFKRVMDLFHKLGGKE